jgi:UDP:flavonoid glycosyltransferase YjiC (YdhE family)
VGHILCVTVDAGGNVPPMARIAAVTARRGHRVTVLGHERVRRHFDAPGIEFVAYRSVRPWDAGAEQSPLRWVPMLNDRRLGVEVTELCRARQPDLALVDCLIAPAHQAVRDLGITRVVLTHSIRGWMADYPRPGRLGGGSPALLYGYRLGDLWDSAALNLVAAHRGTDPARDRERSENVRWTGAVLPPARPADIAGRSPHVVVSMSTNGYPGQRAVLNRVIAALTPMRVRATVTTGGVFDPVSFDAPDHIEVTGFADHGDLMPTTSALIGHGGYSTTMRALSHDIPVVVIPASAFTDQPIVGRAMRDAGVGRLVRRSGSPSSIRSAAEAVLTDESIRGRARELGAQLRTQDGAAVAASALEELLTGPVT